MNCLRRTLNSSESSQLLKLKYFLKNIFYKNLLTKPCKSIFPANIYLFRVSNRNTRKTCEICSKLTIKMPAEPRKWRRSGGFTSNFEHISHGFLAFFVDFEQASVSWHLCFSSGPIPTLHKISTADSLIFFSKHISRTAILT